MLRPSPIGKNVVVFDLEIKNPIQGEITWARHDLMGISVGVAFDYRTMEYRVFMDDNIGDLVRLLNQADIVSGFNILGFDLPLLNATCENKFVNTKAVYDILYKSREAAGLTHFAKGNRLDDHLHGTFGPEFLKTESGAEAPGMWDRKELGRLISYCLGDVRRESLLFEHIYAGNAVNTPLHGFRKLEQP